VDGSTVLPIILYLIPIIGEEKIKVNREFIWNDRYPDTYIWHSRHSDISIIGLLVMKPASMMITAFQSNTGLERQVNRQNYRQETGESRRAEGIWGSLARSFAGIAFPRLM
jgi:hypothetical protein